MSTLIKLLDSRLRHHGTPVIYADERWWSRDEMNVDLGKTRKVLRLLGVKPGDRVLLVAPNSYAFTVLYLGLLSFGAVVVPVSPASPDREVLRVVRQSGAKAALLHTSVLSASMHQWAQWARVQCVAAVQEFPQDGRLLWSFTQLGAENTIVGEGSAESQDPTIESDGEVTQPDDMPWDDSPGVLMYTSGTTGEPKGVILSHGQLLAAVRQVVGSHHLHRADTGYCVLPLSHINAQVVVLLSSLVSGGRVVMAEKFSASQFWPTIEKHRVTWVSAVPAILEILLRREDVGPTDFSSLRFIRSASAPLFRWQQKEFERRFGVPVIQSYGMTEAGSQICVNPLPPEIRKPGSVGKPVGVKLRIVESSGREVRTGIVGEVAIRGDSVIQAYEGDPSARSFRDGWFYTGDLGYKDEDGYVYITGRNKEMINRAGEKIGPQEVEEVLQLHPGVRHVAVLGLPDALYGERVVAYVVTLHLSQGVKTSLEEQLRTLCRNSLAVHKCPVEYHFVRNIPLGPTGKVQRQRLRQQVLAIAEGL